MGVICRNGLVAVLCGFICGLATPVVAQTDSSGIGIKRRGGAVTSKDTSLVIVRPDSVPVLVLTDTSMLTAEKKEFFIKRFIRKDYPNPRKAALISLIIPGAGQVYNKHWWKLPIVYGALGGLVWLETKNIKGYKVLKRNYKAMVDENPATVVDPKYLNQDRVTLKSSRDIARKNLEQSSLLLGLGYLLSVSDAFVDAHLSTFDVSDDLSMKICPKSVPVAGVGPAFGVALVFTLDR